MKEEVTADLKAEKGGREERKNRLLYRGNNTQLGFLGRLGVFCPGLTFRQITSLFWGGKKTTTTTLLKKVLLCKYRIESLFWNDRLESQALLC